MIDKTFGQTVRMWREFEGLQQKTVAAQLGISAAYLCDIEYGRRNPPADDLIAELARILAGPTDYLFYQANRLPPDCRSADVLASTITVGFERFRSTLAEELGVYNDGSN